MCPFCSRAYSIITVVIYALALKSFGYPEPESIEDDSPNHARTLAFLVLAMMQVLRPY